jgi:hypothetical protein
MAIPEQVRKQSEAVQELYKQLNGDPDTSGNAEAGAETVDSADDARMADESVNDNAAQVSGDEHTTGTANTEDENSETYAQRWRSLQGSYNATVRQKTELEQRVTQMEQLLASLSAQQSATQSRAEQAPEQPQRLVSDQEADEYGESIDVMRKVSREELIPVAQRLAQIEGLLQQMQANVVPQVQAVAQRQQVSAEQQFWSDLTSYVPNWREVNDNDGFQSWLLDVDPLTGMARQTYLEEAQRSLDAHRVSAFFRTWLETTGQASVAQSTPAISNELEKQVTPGRSRGVASSTSKQPKTYSPDDIKKFFNEVRSGKYKGREQERDRIERDIFAAQREGRIVVNA